MTRGRWRAIWQSTSRDVQRGRLNTDPPTPVATGQTEMVCTTWLGRTALESSDKQWFLFFLDRLEARDSQTGGVEFVVAGKDSCDGCPKANNPSHESLRKNLLWGGGVSCQSWLPPTRGRWRAVLFGFLCYPCPRTRASLVFGLNASRATRGMQSCATSLNRRNDTLIRLIDMNAEPFSLLEAERDPKRNALVGRYFDDLTQLKGHLCINSQRSGQSLSCFV